MLNKANKRYHSKTILLLGPLRMVCHLVEEDWGARTHMSFLFISLSVNLDTSIY